MADLSDERLEDLNIVAEVERQFAHAAMANALRGEQGRRLRERSHGESTET